MAPRSAAWRAGTMNLNPKHRVLTMEAETYVDAIRDERILNQLKETVRELPPMEASARILEIYAANNRVGLKTANACSRDKSVFKHILLDGISKADLSTVRQWIQCVVPRIGIVATTNVINSVEGRDPILCETCVYWIEMMRLRPSKREAQALARLRETMKEHKVHEKK